MNLWIQRLTAVAVATLSTVWTVSSTVSSAVAAAAFGQQEVDQTRFIAIAAPFAGGTSHQLMILEQVTDARPCWSVLGGTPTLINPLLGTFNFTGICGRSIDANGYSIRVNGEDVSTLYSVRIVRRNQDLVLMGDPIGCFNPDHSKCPNPEFEIGHTDGITPNFAEISLNPGWRFTRRLVENRPVGHIYLTYEGTFPPQAIATAPNTSPPTPVPPAVPPVPIDGTLAFRDIGGDTYAAEIQQAIQLGFIAGFEDGTFRPQRSLTREQLVSMALESLKRIPGTTFSVPSVAAASPYSDVEASRWSAAKIEFAKRNNIVSGYEDGTFRPTQPVTRAEMMAILQRTAEYGRSLRQLTPQLPPAASAPTAFADISAHWAAALISQMSTYCQVASPINEIGSNFAPNTEAQRNYAAAATLRMLNCVTTAQQ
jgi:N-acetylmuramoyl-L-alanine amidase